MKDQEQFASYNAISIDTNLKCSLTLILAKPLLLYLYSFKAFEIVYSAKQELKSNKSLIYICNL
jgi:hypothetical protein